MGHALEDRYPRQFAERVRDFLWRRAQADRRGLRRLGDIYRQPGWNPGEIAWEDEFLEPYMGKFYPVTGTTIDQFREIALSLGPVKRAQIGATEITSMGVELLWTDPLRLLREDPEFFEFIVNLLRGR
jgi:hypothetical protein